MRHKYPYIIILFVLLASIYLVIFSSDSPAPQTNLSPSISPTLASELSDYTASFLIFTNGTRRIFSAPMYHNLSPDVFIESTNPAIIHIKKSEITWKDFFSTLPMGVSPTCITTGTGQSFCTREDDQASTAGTLRFILNGTEDPKVLEKIIHPKDKLLVTFGNASDLQLQQQYDQIPSPIPSPSAPVLKEE